MPESPKVEGPGEMHYVREENRFMEGGWLLWLHKLPKAVPDTFEGFYRPIERMRKPTSTPPINPSGFMTPTASATGRSRTTCSVGADSTIAVLIYAFLLPSDAALTMARIPARTASGRRFQLSVTTNRSGGVGSAVVFPLCSCCVPVVLFERPGCDRDMTFAVPYSTGGSLVSPLECPGCEVF